MAVYFFTGKLGSGKTLCAVGRIQEYLQSGRRVATNLDLDLSAFSTKRHDYKWDVVRLPDKPRLQDMTMLGRGCDEENEDKYGLIVLDELATWFNSRKWQDKERLPLIDWCLHARKHHWDIIFIVQDIDSIDAQLRGALCEHLVTCRRLDRMPIPVLGTLLKLFSIPNFFPKVHVAAVRYGDSSTAPLVKRWVYQGKNLYKAYDTAQVFSDQLQVMTSRSDVVDMRASYTYLSPYHLNGCQRLDRAKNELHEAQSYFKNRTTSALHSTRPVGAARGMGRFSLTVVILTFSIFGLSSYLYFFGGAQAQTTKLISKSMNGLPEPLATQAVLPKPQQLTPLDNILTTHVLRTRSLIDYGDVVYGTVDVYDKKNVLVSTIDIKHIYTAGWKVTRNINGIILHSGIHVITVPFV